MFMRSLEELPSGGRNWRKVLTFATTLHYKRSLYKRLDFSTMLSRRAEADRAVPGQSSHYRRRYAIGDFSGGHQQR